MSAPSDIASSPSTTTASTDSPSTDSPSAPLYYYVLNNTQLGPISYYDVTNLLVENIINDTTLLWKYNYKNWVAVKESEFKTVVPSSSSKVGTMENEYFYKLQSSTIGPISYHRVKEDYNSGLINGQTIGWMKGLTNWVPLCEIVKDIFPKIEEIVEEEVDLEATGYEEEEVKEEDTESKESRAKNNKDNKFNNKTDSYKTNKDNKLNEKSQGDTIEEKKKKRVNHFRELKQIQSIYISNLPFDVTISEISEFCKKCGMVLEDPNTGLPVIFIFVDELGKIRGDASVTFLQSTSVELAVSILDDSLLRVNSSPIKVERGDWYFINKSIQLLKKYCPKVEESNQNKKRKISSQLKQLDWKSGDESSSDDEDLKHKGGKKIIIIKHIFSTQEADNPNYYTELDEEIGEEITQRCGIIDKLTIFEGNPEGVVAVRFKKHSSAEKCLEIFDGRFFDGRKLICEYFDGKTNYKMPSTVTEEDEDQRLEDFGKWLEDQ